MAIDKNAIKEFTKRWKGIGYEKGDTQQYWLQLLRALGYAHSDDVKFEYHLPGGGFIDVWIRDAGVLVEQKGIDIDLDKPEPRQGKMKTPLEQAVDYVIDLPLSEQPRFIITCNFKQFRIYDREKYGRSELANNAFEFTLEELAGRPDYLNIIVDPNNSRLEKEKQVSIEAGRLIGQLYDLMRVGYIDPDSNESRHALNVLCVRLVFCLYCEDADLFPKDAFYNYLKDVPAQNIRMNLKRLFKALDTPVKERDPYDTNIKGFPYVNGGLFKEETEIPNFSEEAKDFLLNKVSAPVNWSQISPTIFGGIFEYTLNPETRHKGGMHYTSPEVIHKVIDPLFLDDLKSEFNSIRSDDELTPRQKKNRYKAFLQKLSSLKFLDPAAGSGNFLTETYLCLRKLEDSVLIELRDGQASYGFEEDEEKGKRVSLNQFYGIEINDFAVAVAETALWISRLKANGEESMLISSGSDFPLHERAIIIHDNALRKDWRDVISPDECNYIMGNPPFVARSSRVALSDGGAKSMTSASVKEEKAAILGKKSGDLDYVACWFKLASQYIHDTNIKCAFISTNSICQGEQVAPVWSQILDDRININFAYQSFKWKSEGNDSATVYVVIVGLTATEDKQKKIFHEDGTVELTTHINPYLTHHKDVFVWSRVTPLFDVPSFGIGSQPIDGGHYMFNEDEKIEFLRKEPKAEKFFHPWLVADELLKGKKRYVLWLGNATEEELDELPLCSERISLVKELRMKSNRAQTKKAAMTPNHFGTEIISNSYSLVIPEVSSMSRRYLPLGFIGPETFCSNKVRFAPNASLYHFGILQSQFHNAWMRAVCGYFGPSYQYSVGVVYNNFIWPTPTESLKANIEGLAQKILDARANHPNKHLADLYDPDKMPADLLAAHTALDQAVEEAYGVDFKGDEERIINYLFDLYTKKTSK